MRNILFKEELEQVIEDIFVSYVDQDGSSSREELYRDKPEDHFSISSAGKCFLEQSLKYINTTPTNKPDADGFKRMRDGTQMHEDLNKAIKWATAENFDNWNELYEKRTEKYVKLQDVPVHGHYDLALINHEKRHFLMVDFKTVSTWVWASVKKDPKRNHKMQVYTYALGLAEELKKQELKDYTFECFIFYINKNDIKFHVTHVQEDWEEMALSYWNNLVHFKDNENLDDIKYKHGSLAYIELLARYKSLEMDGMIGGVPFAAWECQYCDFQDMCPKKQEKPKPKRRRK